MGFLGFGKRIPPTYAKPKPKTITISPEEVAALMALVGVMYDNNRPLPEDEDLRELVLRCVEAKHWVHAGSKVTLFIPMGEMQ